MVLLVMRNTSTGGRFPLMPASAPASLNWRILVSAVAYIAPSWPTWMLSKWRLICAIAQKVSVRKGFSRGRMLQP